MKPICWIAVLCIVSVPAAGVAVARQTDDAGQDVIAALLAEEKFDDAEWLCRFERQRSGSDLLRYARWSSRLAMVIGQREANSLFAAKPAELPERLSAAIQTATKPIETLVADADNADVNVFLEAGGLAVRQRQLRAAIIITTVAPTPQEVVDDLLTRISRLQRDAIDLRQNARDLWSLRQTAVAPSDRRDTLPADEYERLIGELSVDQIALALLQTELFPRNSGDYRAAAADAVAVAEQVLPSLTDRTPAKRAAKALLAKALLRSGDVDRAGHLIREAAGAPADTQADLAAWTALAVDYQLARGETETAQTICETYYRLASHANSEPSDFLQMDFARLRVLLAAGGDQQKLTSWLEIIGDRGGSFAKRRAEAIVVASLGRGDGGDRDAPAPSTVDPGLIAIQGEDALRRNEPQRAAALLRQAALAATDSATSIQYATKAAAAAVAAGDATTAVAVLCETARKHPTNETAADLMMQAALMQSEQVRAASADGAEGEIETLLNLLAEISQTWPQSKPAFQANQWRCGILESAQKPSDAASAALEFLLLRKKADQLPPTADRWFDYLSALPTGSVDQPLSTLTAALDEWVQEQPDLRPAVDRVAAWLFDPNTLDRRLVESDSSNTFLNALMRFRQGDASVTFPFPVPAELRDRVRWRLQRDAVLQPERRSRIGQVLLQFPDATPWQEAVAQFWAVPDQNSITALKQLAVKDPNPQTSLERAIDLLSQSNRPEAMSAAVELADRMATTFPIGDDAWYEAKLRAIELLIRSGNGNEAKKRAKYVLLVRPPGDPSLRKRFEAVAESGR